MTKNDAKVLEAAGRLFREQGFAATTVREIAEGAGMLPGSLHYRYPTKESLLVALMEQGMRHATATVRAAAESGSDPLDRMRRALAAHLRLLVEADAAIYVNLYEFRSVRGEARTRIVALRDAYEALWEGLFNRAAGAGLLRPGVDHRLARHLLLGAVNWSAQWYRPAGSRTPESIAEGFLGLVAEGILDPSARPVESAFDPEAAMRVDPTAAGEEGV